MLFVSEEQIFNMTVHGYRMRLRLLPEPLAEEFDTRGRWKTAWPDCRLIPDGHPVSDDKSEPFVAAIPPAVREIVRVFSTHQWMLLLLLTRSSMAVELASTNPVLAYAMANNHEFRRTSCRVAEQLALFHSGQKQKDICKWLGFPGTQAMVNLFRRMDPRTISPSLLRRLRLALEDEPVETMKLLGHMEKISAGIIDIVVEQRVRHMITPQLLDEIKASEAELCISAADDLFHVLSIARAMGGDLPRHQVSSLAKLRRIVEEADRRHLEYRRMLAERERLRCEEMERVEAARQEFMRLQRQTRGSKKKNPESRAWPPPPLPGTADIVPITSFRMLCEEGELQHHCIATYLYYITVDKACLYAYRLLKPQRATFTIARRVGNSWGLAEIKGIRNGPVNDDARLAVEKWLKYYQKPVRAAELPTGMA